MGNSTSTSNKFLCESFIKAFVKSDYECIRLIYEDPKFKISMVEKELNVPLCYYLLIAVYMDNFDWNIFDLLIDDIKFDRKLKKVMHLTYEKSYKIIETSEMAILEIPKDISFMNILYNLMAKFSGDDGLNDRYINTKYIIEKYKENSEKSEESDEGEDESEDESDEGEESEEIVDGIPVQKYHDDQSSVTLAISIASAPPKDSFDT